SLDLKSVYTMIQIKNTPHLRSSSRYSSDLEYHVKNDHSNVVKWPCSKCTRNHWEHFHLQQHYLMFHLEKTIKCSTPGCDFTTKSRAEMNTHNRNEHSDIVIDTSLPGTSSSTTTNGHESGIRFSSN